LHLEPSPHEPKEQGRKAVLRTGYTTREKGRHRRKTGNLKVPKLGMIPLKGKGHTEKRKKPGGISAKGGNNMYRRPVEVLWNRNCFETEALGVATFPIKQYGKAPFTS